MKIISIYNNKGGVGKTTTTKYLAKHLASNSKKVLLIDMDPQSNLSRSFLKEDFNPYANHLSTYDLLMNDNQITEIAVKIDSCIDIIPASDRHNDSNNDMLLNAVKKSPATRLKNKLSKCSDYDYVLIDCAPTKDLLATNSLTASDEVLIPLSMDNYAIDGIRGVLSLIESVKSEFNDNLKIAGIFLNGGKTSDIYNNLHNQLCTELPKIMLNTKVANYVAVNKDTFNIDSKINKGEEQFTEVFKEVQYV